MPDTISMEPHLPTRLAILATLLLALIFAQNSRALGADTRFLTHSLDKSVYFEPDGTLRGIEHAGRRAFYVEVVRAMMAEYGKVTPIKEVSLSRGFHLLDREINYAFFNVIRNEERKDIYKWVGPTHVFPTYFYELGTAPTGIKTIEDSKAVASICALNGNNLIGYMERLGFTNIFKANSNDACAKLLAYGRVKLIPGSEYPWFMADPELATKLVRTPVIVSVDEGYIAFTIDTPDSEIRKWQAALDRIKANGVYDQVEALYMRPVLPEAPVSVSATGAPADNP